VWQVCWRVRRSPPWLLELQPTLASGIGDGLDATVIQEPTAVKNHSGYASFLRPLRDQFPDCICALGLRAALLADSRFEAAAIVRPATSSMS
jgi:hypothetical protein